MSRLPYVLVIEDDEWLAEQYVVVLQRANMKADYATNAIVAMDKIDAVRPDVVVLDVLLPGSNAFVLLHELQSHSDLGTIPVILCTNTADYLHEKDVRPYGVKRILDKTAMHPSDIVTAVKGVL